MFKILDEVNNLSLFYKINHLSSFMKSIVFIYLIMFFGFSFLILKFSEYNDSWGLIPFMGIVFFIAFLFSLSRDYSYFDSYEGSKGLNKVEFDFILELNLYRYIDMSSIFKLIYHSLSDDKILISKEVSSYVDFLKSRLNTDEKSLDENEKLFLKIYNKIITEKKEIYKNL